MQARNPIAFASISRSGCEKRYANIERERERGEGGEKEGERGIERERERWREREMLAVVFRVGAIPYLRLWDYICYRI